MNRLYKSVLSFFILLVSLMFVSVQTAQAVVICVDDSSAGGATGADCEATCDGSNDCSLSDAIDHAENISAGPDEIIFDPAVFDPSSSSTIIDDTFMITESLTITGPGLSALEINGSDTGLIFMVDSSGGAITFDITGISFVDGNPVIQILDSTDTVNISNSLFLSNSNGGEDGGVILNRGGTLNVTNSSFIDNTTTADGGAIATQDSSNDGTGTPGTTTITDCYFAQNTTDSSGDHGAAIANLGGSVTTIHNSTFENNISAANGGAIFSEGSGTNTAMLTIADSLFQNNETEVDGGAIYIADADNAVTITDSTFIGNIADPQEDDGGVGGAIDFDGTGTISGSHFINNSAPDEDGGAISNHGDLSIQFTNFTNNSAVSVGGAIWNDGSANLTLENSTFYGNHADNSGGAIFNDDVLSIMNSTFSNNDVGGAGTEGGGAIFNDDGTLDMTNSTVFNNAAYDGGGIYNSGSGASVTITNSTISGNKASNDGGGIFNDSSTDDSNPNGYAFSLINVTVTNNLADSNFDDGGEGGGITQQDGAGTFRIANSIIAGNIDPSSTPDCDTESAGSSGVITSDNFNIIGNNINCDGLVPAADDQIGTASEPIDPLLGSLFPADGGDPANGGVTGTHEPQDGSPAIDMGPTDPLDFPATDQHDVPRPIGAASDIGAIEVGCGDGVVQAGEECDDDGESATCDANCTLASCGDGDLNATAGETCDDSNTDDGDACSSSCTVEECGNSIVDSDETCDDGNVTDGDGCDSTCQIEPGDTDGDGVTDDVDNCPNDINADQADSDDDGFGDACDIESGSSGCSLSPIVVSNGVSFFMLLGSALSLLVGLRRKS